MAHAPSRKHVPATTKSTPPVTTAPTLLTSALRPAEGLCHGQATVLVLLNIVVIACGGYRLRLGLSGDRHQAFIRRR